MPALAPRRLGQVAIRARDIARATAFYRDVLGLPHLFSAPPGLAFFRCGEVRLMLAVPEPEFDHPASVLYYLVDDLSATHAALAAQGVEVVHAPRLVHRAADHELWIGFIRDSEGNTLGLMQEKPLA